MRSPLRLAIIFISIALVLVVFGWLTTRQKLVSNEREQVALSTELATANSRLAAQQQQIDSLQKELERSKAAAVEVHKLRGEVTQLRAAAQAAEKLKLSQTPGQKPGPIDPPEAVAPPAPPPLPPKISDVIGQVAPLRAKAFNGTLTKEEREYLASIKPELEKLERSPKDFAELQAGFIQAATGISDQERIDQIQAIIEKTSSAAVTRGLDLPSSKPEDETWALQRNQLDRRGTQAVQHLMSDSERAAFDRVFVGVLGVDLGTGR
jgi:hypothetical protein